MNFKDWFEAVNVMDASTDNIQLQQIGSSTFYYFKIDGVNYNVEMEPTLVSIGGLDIDGYTIYFKGPNGFNLTGDAGGSAAKIYTQVLLGIKKFLETKVVNALEFSAFEPAMKVVYDRFYKNYLKSEFVKFSRGNYVRKSYLKEIWPQLSNNLKNKLLSNVLDTSRWNRDSIKAVKDNKIQMRQKRLEANSFIGLVMMINTSHSSFPWPGLIYRADAYNNEKYYFNALSGVFQNVVHIRAERDEIIKEADVNSAKKLLELILNNPTMKAYVDDDVLIKAMQRYGVNQNVPS